MAHIRNRPSSSSKAIASRESIQDWHASFDQTSDVRLAEIQRNVKRYNLFEGYCNLIDRIPEDARKENFLEFLSTCKSVEGEVGNGLSDQPGVSQATESKCKALAKAEDWSSRLRGQRKVPPAAPMRTPAFGGVRPIMLKTPAGNVRLPRAITPKIRNGTDVKFRALRREEVAFSVAGTPVISREEIGASESVELVNQLLHAKDEELTPATRSVVRGMKQLIGRILPSEGPDKSP